MKYTGIVRRLDSLGRVVIPREYRKMLKIREADPLEIVALENGDIVVRKIDISAELVTNGENVVKQLFDTCGHTVMLSDTEKFLIGQGTNKSTFVDTVLPSKVQALIESRKGISGEGAEFGMQGHVAMQPVYLEDCFGAIFIISNEPITAENERLLRTVAKILGGMMQRY